MTKNLDGETNLKKREVQQDMKGMIDSEADFGKLTGGKFKIEAPNDKIEKFEGMIQLPNGQSYALDKSNLLLRGCVLRNTTSIIGLVTFTGEYTKIMQNSRPAKPKKSDLERKMQFQIMMVFIMLVFFCTIASILYIAWYNKYSDVIGYI